jgi:hypothetical protein
MQEMGVMLLLEVPSEDLAELDAELLGTGMEDPPIPVRLSCFRSVIVTDKIGKGGQANGGSINEVNNGLVTHSIATSDERVLTTVC